MSEGLGCGTLLVLWLCAAVCLCVCGGRGTGLGGCSSVVEGTVGRYMVTDRTIDWMEEVVAEF